VEKPVAGFVERRALWETLWTTFVVAVLYEGFVTPDVTPSSAFLKAMNKELERLAKTRDKLSSRRSALVEELREIEAGLGTLEFQEERLRAAGAGASDEVPSIHPRSGNVIKGAEIRETAARKVFLTHGAGRALHYRRWLTLLLEDGYEIAGQDPAATFLTNLSRSPVIRRAGQPGEYEIDPDALERLQASLGEVEAELRDITEVLAGPRDDEGQLREHRAHLAAEARRLEGLLAEAERVLAPAEEDSEVETIRAVA